MRFSSFLAALACAQSALAISVKDISKGMRAPPAVEAAVESHPNSTFEQLIDHDNPSLGTFSQFYFYDDTYYKGPGSPVILFTPGEINVTNYYTYLSKNRTTGLFAQAVGAAIVVLEHRYWGNSSPFANLSTVNLQYLTLKNSIADLTHFAKTVRLPFDPKGTSTADKAPWVLSGGSYSGALSAWTASTAPGTFWAYHASSAPVEAIYNYWQYFYPIQEGMPKNCSTDINLVIDHFDSVFENGTAADQAALKEMFGVSSLQHPGDIGSFIASGPFLWQSNQFYYNGGFFSFCDAVENADTPGAKIPGAEGVGLQKALAGYAKWVKKELIPGYCAGYGYTTDKYDLSCLDTYNLANPLYNDWSLSNTVDRQWTWFLCNEPFFYWQTGAPKSRPTLVSRYTNAAYYQRQCKYYFPTMDGHTYGSADGRTADTVNSYTHGWDITNTTRLIWANGQYDPWRESGVSSDFRPGGPLKSTSQAPIEIVPGGFHTSDLLPENGAVNPAVNKVIMAIVAQIKTWVAEYPGCKGKNEIPSVAVRFGDEGNKE